jgi:hypothetical protein
MSFPSLATLAAIRRTPSLTCQSAREAFGAQLFCPLGAQAALVHRRPVLGSSSRCAY